MTSVLGEELVKELADEVDDCADVADDEDDGCETAELVDVGCEEEVPL